MSNESFSKHERLLACPASGAIPGVTSPSDFSTERGSGVHSFIVDARKNGREAALADMSVYAPHRKLCESLPLDELPQGGKLELALAWDYEKDTARIVGENIGRNYGKLGPTEMPGTADLAGTVNGQVVIVDWKSGFRSLGPASESAQLKSLALAMCRVTGLDSAHVSYMYLKEDGTFYRDSAELDALDLAEHAERLRSMVKEVGIMRQAVAAGLTPRVATGEHCRYCEAFASCPAQSKLARALVTEPAEIEAGIAALTLEQAGSAWARLDEFDAIAKRIRESLKERAKNEPIPLPDGRVVRQVDWPFTEISGDAAYQILAEKYGGEFANSACSFDVSQASVERALRQKKIDITPLSAQKKKVMEELEAAGAVRRGTKPQIRAARP